MSDDSTPSPAPGIIHESVDEVDFRYGLPFPTDPDAFLYTDEQLSKVVRSLRPGMDVIIDCDPTPVTVVDVVWVPEGQDPDPEEVINDDDRRIRRQTGPALDDQYREYGTEPADVDTDQLHRHTQNWRCIVSLAHDADAALYTLDALPGAHPDRGPRLEVYKGSLGIDPLTRLDEERETIVEKPVSRVSRIPSPLVESDYSIEDRDIEPDQSRPEDARAAGHRVADELRNDDLEDPTVLGYCPSCSATVLEDTKRDRAVCTSCGDWCWLEEWHRYGVEQ